LKDGGSGKKFSFCCHNLFQWKSFEISTENPRRQCWGCWGQNMVKSENNILKDFFLTGSVIGVLGNLTLSTFCDNIAWFQSIRNYFTAENQKYFAALRRGNYFIIVCLPLPWYFTSTKTKQRRMLKILNCCINCNEKDAILRVLLHFWVMCQGKRKQMKNC